MDNTTRKFSDKMRDLRDKLGITQGQLAELTGLSQNFISRIESGSKGVSLDTALKIASGLNVLPSELFDSSVKLKAKSVYLKKFELILNSLSENQQKTFADMALDIADKLKKHK